MTSILTQVVVTLAARLVVMVVSANLVGFFVKSFSASP